MSSNATTVRAGSAGTTTKQKVGLVLCALNGLSNTASVLFPTDAGDVGPPFAILVIDSVLGLVCIVGAVLAWRGNAVANRIAAGATIVIAISALPAFFVPVPLGIKVLVAVSVLLTVVIVALMFSSRRRDDADR